MSKQLEKMIEEELIDYAENSMSSLEEMADALSAAIFCWASDEELLDNTGVYGFEADQIEGISEVLQEYLMPVLKGHFKTLGEGAEYIGAKIKELMKWH
jgi:hypothetical protein